MPWHFLHSSNFGPYSVCLSNGVWAKPEMHRPTLAEKLLEMDPTVKIVFITGWNQYAVAAYKPERHHTFKAVMDSSALYGEGFLAQNGYLWSSYKGEEIRQKLSEILKEIAENSIGSKRLPVLRQLAVFSPCDIQVQLDYIQELKLYDKASEMARHFAWLINTLRKDFDTELPENTVKLFEKFVTSGGK